MLGKVLGKDVLSLRKRCSEHTHQMYRRTTMSKCDFNEVALQLYRNRTSVWVLSCNFAVYFQNTFSLEHLCKSLYISAFLHDFVSCLESANLIKAFDSFK